MIETIIIIPNKAGLHARAAAKLVSTASAYNSSITLANPEKSVDGKSILSIMLLAAPQGSELKLSIDGDDEEQALAAITSLLEDRFGEE